MFYLGEKILIIYESCLSKVNINKNEILINASEIMKVIEGTLSRNLDVANTPNNVHICINI